MTEKNGRKFTVRQRIEARGQALEMAEAGMTQQAIAEHFDVSQGTVCHWLNKARGKKHLVAMRAATKIRAELVCCDIFDQVEMVRRDLVALQQLKESKAYHDMCYFGEWAARIAEKTS